jgi:hypothetical protein
MFSGTRSRWRVDLTFSKTPRPNLAAGGYFFGGRGGETARLWKCCPRISMPSAARITTGTICDEREKARCGLYAEQHLQWARVIDFAAPLTGHPLLNPDRLGEGAQRNAKRAVTGGHLSANGAWEDCAVSL